MKKAKKTKEAAHTPPWALEAVAHLQKTDPVMARIILEAGPVQITRRPENFQALVRAIIFQQLAGSAALAIFNRFVAMIGGGRFPSADKVAAASDEDLRKAGLSRGKMAYIRDLAAKVRDGRINFRRFPKLDDEEIIAELTAVRGIGRWTAEMFLMFNLWRPDVLAVGDLGLRSAATRHYGANVPITEKGLRELGERWRPYRTAAAWYLWQSGRIVTPDAVQMKATVARSKKLPAKPPAARRGRLAAARSSKTK
ncbi:MAG TPA: DNA-3-methyladenine glycosylase [Candidatus Binataceae bacterium]|nr:DNA-3-methyladenine glycosylase [Candidatus Binataceae bacterium]